MIAIETCFLNVYHPSVTFHVLEYHPLAAYGLEVILKIEAAGSSETPVPL
jgi:hypothetical protein